MARLFYSLRGPSRQPRIHHDVGCADDDRIHGLFLRASRNGSHHQFHRHDHRQPLPRTCVFTSGRHRDLSAFFLSLMHLLAWLWFFSSPSPRGLAVIIAMMVLMALSSPSSNYGFDQIRETLDRNVVATATG